MKPADPRYLVSVVGTREASLVATRIDGLGRVTWRVRLAGWLIDLAGRLMRVRVEYRDP